tara:strand:+ start:1447 stop:2163 length:717 start_codon:yes stop_codon:yes gene_type:complete
LSLENERQYRKLIYLSSNKIREDIKAQKNLWKPRPFTCRPADNIHWEFPFMATTYYDLVYSQGACPTQRQFWGEYMQAHDGKFQCLSEDVRVAMRGRVCRAYNSFVLEHHLLAIAVESRQFDVCFKSEYYDVFGKVDLIVKRSGNAYGVESYISTSNSLNWLATKRNRPKANLDIPIVSLPLEIHDGEKIAGINLYPLWYIDRLVAIIEAHDTAKKQLTQAQIGEVTYVDSNQQLSFI